MCVFALLRILSKLTAYMAILSSVRTGSIRSVVLFKYDTAKETMANPDFVNRPAFFNEISIDDRKKGGSYEMCL